VQEPVHWVEDILYWVGFIDASQHIEIGEPVTTRNYNKVTHISYSSHNLHFPFSVAKYSSPSVCSGSQAISTINHRPIALQSQWRNHEMQNVMYILRSKIPENKHLTICLTVWRHYGVPLTLLRVENFKCKAPFFAYQKCTKSASHDVDIVFLAQSVGNLWPKLPTRPQIWALAVLSGIWSIRSVQQSLCISL